MPNRRLRKRFVRQLKNDLRVAGELGLAFLLTAGVVGCGGTTVPAGDAGIKDSSAKDARPGFDGAVVEAAQIEGGVRRDAGIGVEAAHVEGGVVEAAQVEGGIVTEAAQVEGGMVGEAGHIIDSGRKDGGVAVEGASFPDAGHG